ncbi:MAG TPA: hypothetical protein VFJ58_05580 [Armatimonadota bacterium]|nr:hypothetical protein [Armatimonadota bacterium]
MPVELKACLTQGADTTLMVWSNLDDDMADGPALKKLFWAEAKKAGISKSQFDTIVFIFAKDRLENWVEFLTTGATDETREGPRGGNDRAAAAAVELAKRCGANAPAAFPPSLKWSCKNWRVLVQRMTSGTQAS